MLGSRVSVTSHIFLFKSLFFVLLGFSITRLVFLLFQIDYFPNLTFTEYAGSLLHGLRFDASVIALLNLPLLLVLLAFAWSRRTTSISNSLVLLYVLLINIPALITNLIDTVYFTYTGRRSGPEIVSMFNDVSSQIPQLAMEYWYFVLLGLLLIYCFVTLLSALKKRCLHYDVAIWQYVILVFVILFMMTFFARGGLQSKPIRALHAYSWPSSSLGAVVLNTPFTLLRQSANNLKKLNYYETNQEAYDFLNGTRPSPAMQDVSDTKQNVVVIILESFALEYFGPPYGKKNYVPFLTSLTEKGRFFPNGVANGRRSIEAVPSILAGMPSLMSEAFTRSPFQANEIFGLGQLLKPYGYSTAFFHGAKNGSMYFDATTQRLGFDAYFGRDEHPNSEDFDGQWGIFDEPFLQFSVNQIDQLKTPFIASIFTISSHPPYRLPTKYEGMIPEGDIPMHRVIQYGDIALKSFFDTAKTMDWYDNTLFVITADHTSDNFDLDFATPFGRHQIPILLYHPKDLVKSSIETQIAQQVDIPATIVDFLALPITHKLLPFGQSLLQTNKLAGALIKEEGSFWYLSQNKYIKINQADDKDIETGDLPSTFMQESNMQGERTITNSELEKHARAYLQLYFNGLIDNQHYFEKGR